MVARKERMIIMRAGKGAMTAKQLGELIEFFPKTQIFESSGYWTDNRTKAIMK